MFSGMFNLVDAVNLLVLSLSFYYSSVDDCVHFLGFDAGDVENLCDTRTKVQQEGSGRSSENGRRPCKIEFTF